MNESQIVWISSVNDKPFYCRICVLLSYSECDVHETVVKDDQTMSLYTMMEKIAPTAFNAAQMEVDESMNWPNKICVDCRRRVLDAYDLYDMCVNSVDKLSKCLPQEEMLETVIDDIEEEKPIFVEDPTVEVKMKSEENVEPIHRVTMQKKPTISLRKIESIQVEISDENEEECSVRISRSDQCSDGNNERATVVPNEPKVGRKAVKKSRNEKKLCGPSELNKETIKRNKLLQQMEKSLKIDMKSMEGNIDEFRCLLCTQPAYNSPPELTEHLKAEHLDQIHACELCPMVFMSEQPFQNHQYCHATGRSYFCSFCDKGFQTERLQKNHMRTHTQRSNYLCYLCGKEFNNNGNFRQHMKLHSGGKPWACSLCPSRFTTNGSLKVHQATHTKEKAFGCEICGTRFNKNYSLIKHRLIHTGERPFCCEVCNMRFRTNYMVKRHMRTHTGEKPYKCAYCNRNFAQSNDMVKHMKTHVGNRPYQCDRCDATFRLLTNLRNHYKKHYEGDETEAGSVANNDNGIRFTSMNILKLRYEKDMKSNRGS